MTLGRDGIAGLVLLAISLALLVQSYSLPSVPLVPIGPGFYPRIVLVFLAVCSAALIAQDIRARRRGDAKIAAASWRLHPLVLACFGVVAAYCYLLPLLGFRLATPLFVAAMQWTIEKPRGAKAWTWLAGVALAASAVSYLVFETYLLVLLPRGSLTGW
jgi:hypothetical protein